MRALAAGSRFFGRTVPSGSSQRDLWPGRLRSKRQRAVTGAVTAALVIVPLAMSGCSSSKSAGTTGTSSGGQSGAAFYAGKKITLIAPDAAGGSHAEFAQIVAPYIGKYLHAQVAVENVAAGHTIAGQAQLESSKPDGLTIGLTDVGAYEQDVLSGQNSLPTNPADLAQLGSLTPGTDSVIVQTDSPYKTFADIVSSKQTIKALLLPGVGSAEMQAVFQAYNIKVQYITGYANAKDLMAGFLRGDGELVTTNLLNTGQVVSAGKARPVLVTGAVPAGNKSFAGAQSLQQFAASNPISNSKQADELKQAESRPGDEEVAAPVGVPAAELTALQSAVKYALGQSAVKSDLLKEGFPDGYLTPAQAKSMALAAEAAYKALAADGVKL
jgi:tripartite-type tricarboxylate transporter receptor subunit TctC